MRIDCIVCHPSGSRATRSYLNLHALHDRTYSSNRVTTRFRAYTLCVAKLHMDFTVDQ